MANSFLFLHTFLHTCGHTINTIPGNNRWLLFWDAQGEEERETRWRWKVPRVPPSKLIKYTIWLFQIALVDKLRPAHSLATQGNYNNATVVFKVNAKPELHSRHTCFKSTRLATPAIKSPKKYIILIKKD